MSEINLLTNYKPKINYIPLLSISGISLLSLGGLILLKGKTTASAPLPPTDGQPSQSDPKPTQVPKSIQHYLLASQQYFTQAITTTDQNEKINLVNQSIIAATNAIKEFPQDYRGYHQRGRIYQSLIDSKPELLNQTIADYSSAFKLNQSSAEVSRDLATAYAKKGDAQNTIAYLTQTVSLEPTKAQNFYDLAKIQQQAGYLADALKTYDQLISLVTDPTQKVQIETEKSALAKIVATNPQSPSLPSSAKVSPIETSPTLDSPTIQASLADKGLIIAAPEAEKKIEVSNQTDSNSLSGNSILLSNQSSITINNSNITDTAQIYVVATKGGKNKNLKVISKTNGSFVVGFDSALTEDVEFKWWIIK